MKNKLSLLIGIIVLVVLLAYMFTFQVRYDEVAVRTTFDRAVPPEFDEAGNMVDSGTLYYEPGLKFRLPPPIQRIYKYSRKLNLIEDELEQIMTAEGHTIVLRTYVTWRIADPYQFFQQVGDVPTAERRINELMRAVRGVISSYRFDELVNSDPERLKLEQIEAEALAHLRDELEEIEPGLGIEIDSFGIRRILLPGATSDEVFARMRATRERMAEDILARGRSEAASIRNEAEATRQIILDFADRRAAQIRAEGDTEAARYWEAFADHQDLAIFLREIEMLQETLAHNTTFILNANQLSVLRPFIADPGAEPEDDEPLEAGAPDATDEVREALEAVDRPRELSPDQWEQFQQWQRQQQLDGDRTGADAGRASNDLATP